MTQPQDSYALRTLADLPVLTWPAFDRYPVQAFVTTREGGFSAGAYASLNLGLHVGDDDGLVLKNRARVASAVGAHLDDFVFCDQAHRPNVQVVTQEHRGRGVHGLDDAIPDTDALVTSVPGIVLVTMMADCVPVILFDPVAHVLACVHAGWGGTVRGVTTAALEAMRSLGSDPGDVIAGIGPAIHPDRYQVGTDVADLARAAFGDRADDVIHPDGSGRWTFDLWRANTIQLTAGGVPQEQVHLAAVGTGRTVLPSGG